MGKNWTSEKTLCPYYRCEERQVIHCEGPLPGTSLHLAFNSPRRLKLHKGAYCDGCFDGCIIAKTLNAKWEEAPEG